jgi:16S rRNA (uracil1498-N3)-methyltransferase
MARRRFFVGQVSRGRAVISGDEAHHLTRVLRVEAGQKYEISDNAGVWLAEVEEARKNRVTFAILEQLESRAAPVEAVLCVALVRFERIELLVEKATELGAASIVLFPAERSEKGLERAAEKRLARWERIVREASEQSRRSRLPVIELARNCSDVTRMEARVRVLLDEGGDAAPLLHVLPGDPREGDRVLLLCGPEGGWTERERGAIRDAGWSGASLGDMILRTETAAIAALSIVSAHWFGRTPHGNPV